MQQKVKRFYKTASAAPAETGGYAVLLDGRPLRTPAKALLILPAEPLAAAIAEEWQGQGAEVDPRAMPLNALACTALVAATRDLFGNPNPFPSDSWPGEHALLLSFAWTIGLLAVFAPVAVRRYRSIER